MQNTLPCGSRDSDSEIAEHKEKFSETAFFLKKSVWPRSWCIAVVSSHWFDNVTILVIILNCVCMSLYQPCANCMNNNRCKVLDSLDHAVLAYFICEMLTKMIAFGVYGNNSYFSSGWRRVDFLIVAAGLTEVILEATIVGKGRKKLKVLSVVRVLRPLTTVNQVPSVKQIVNLLLDTLPRLANVLILCGMMYFLCGIIGVQLWSGIFRNRCFIGNSTMASWALDMGLSSFYGSSDTDDAYLCSRSGLGGHKCHDLALRPDCFINGTDLVNMTNYCYLYDTCLPEGPNPFREALNFDNIFYAFLTIFVVISKEGWVDVMYYTQDTQSFWTWIYYMAVIVVGAMFMLNLFLVVISIQFTELKRREQKRLRTYYINMETIISAANESPNLYDALVSFLHSSFLKLQHLVKRNKVDSGAAAAAGKWFGGAILLNQLRHIDKMDKATQTQGFTAGWLDKTVRRFHRFVRSQAFSRIVIVSILLNAAVMALEHHGQPKEMSNVLEIFNVLLTAVFTVEMVFKLLAYGIHGYFKDPFNLFDSLIVIMSLADLIQRAGMLQNIMVLRCFRLLRILKLVRFLPSLRFEITVLFNALDDITVFAILMSLFILMFSLMGMVLFGKKFCWKFDGTPCSCLDLSFPGQCRCQRTNFDTFLNASLTVFQILTTEDWNEVLFNAMQRTTHWSALYFVFLIAIGNYMLFNLLIAIIVEGFQNQKSKERAMMRVQLQQNLMKKRSQQLFIDYRALRVRAQMRRGYRSAILRRLRENFVPDIYEGSYNPSISVQMIDEDDDEPIIDERLPLLVKMIKSRSQWESVPHLVTAQIRRQLFITRSAENLDLLQQKTIRKYNLIARKRRSTICGICPVGSDMGTQTEPSVHRIRTLENWVRRTLRQKDSVKRDLTQMSRLSASDDYRMISPMDWTLAAMEKQRRGRDIQKMRVPQLLLQQRLDFRLKEKYRDTPFYRKRRYAFYCCSESVRLRQACKFVAENKAFEALISVLIALSCLAISLDRPSLDPRGWENQLITITNYVATAVFTLEMVVKLISQGCIFGPNSYLKNPWNVLDGSIVIACLIDIGVELTWSSDRPPDIFSVVKVLRLLRALRPLRFISRAPSLRLAVRALLASLKEIGVVLVICCMFFLIFGILGVQMFKGSMYYCQGPSILNITSKAECENFPENSWINRRYNFDNLGNALLTLFTISTLDSWVKVMHQGIDAVGVDRQPILNHNHWACLYFLAFILVVGFLVLNMFVGILVDKFQDANVRLKTLRKRRKGLLLKSSLYNDPDAKRTLGSSRYALDDGASRSGKFERFIKHKFWHRLYEIVVTANIICIGLEHHHMTMHFAQTLQYCYMGFLVWYVMEAILKAAILGLCTYLRDKWHWLELSIIFLCLIGIAVSLIEPVADKEVGVEMNYLHLRLLRTGSIFRVFLLVVRIFKGADGVWELVRTLTRSVPDIANICILFFILFFICAALGVELFGRLECSLQHPCEALDEHANFTNFGMAFLTLFRILTGDNWSGIFKDALRSDCDSSEDCIKNCCPNQFLTILYFVIFIMTAQYVLLNVAVAMLMKGLTETHRELFEDSVATAYIAGKLDALKILPNHVSVSV